jgi:hypothetical protein
VNTNNKKENFMKYIFAKVKKGTKSHKTKQNQNSIN